MADNKYSFDCKHWLFKSCPQYSNPIMRKFDIPQNPRPIMYTDSKDQEAVEALCRKCDKFELLSFKTES